jgi:hypothetical protein
MHIHMPLLMLLTASPCQAWSVVPERPTDSTLQQDVPSEAGFVEGGAAQAMKERAAALDNREAALDRREAALAQAEAKAAQTRTALATGRRAHLLDYIEVGCSDFNTLLQRTTLRGISVEPVPLYFQRLNASRPGAIKVNAAVSNVTSQGVIYWADSKAVGSSCDDAFRKAHHMSACLPNYMRGMNKIGSMNEVVAKHIRDFGGDPSDETLVHRTPIRFLTMKDVFDDYNVESVNYIKVDTEGHDATVVRSLIAAYRENPLRAPDHLFYENNHLPPGENEKLMAELRAINAGISFKCHLYEQEGIAVDDFMYKANTACSRIGAITPFPDVLAI